MQHNRGTQINAGPILLIALLARQHCGHGIDQLDLGSRASPRPGSVGLQTTLLEPSQKTAEVSSDELRQVQRNGSAVVFDSRLPMEYVSQVHAGAAPCAKSDTHVRRKPMPSQSIGWARLLLLGLTLSLLPVPGVPATAQAARSGPTCRDYYVPVAIAPGAPSQATAVGQLCYTAPRVPRPVQPPVHG